MGSNPLVYHWLARYTDGGQLPQFEGDQEHLFSEVDQRRLASMTLVPCKEGLHPHTVALGDGRRLILVRRNLIHVTGGVESGRETIYLLGWQQTVNGSNIKSILYVYEDGRTVLDGD